MKRPTKNSSQTKRPLRVRPLRLKSVLDGQYVGLLSQFTLADALKRASSQIRRRIFRGNLIKQCLRRGLFLVRRVCRLPTIRKMCNRCMKPRFYRSQRDFEDIADLFVRKLMKIGEE